MEMTTEPWHWHTKQKKMMRMEIEDAFEMRKTVVVILVAAMVGAALGCVWVAKWVMRTVVSRFKFEF